MHAMPYVTIVFVVDHIANATILGEKTQSGVRLLHFSLPVYLGICQKVCQLRIEWKVIFLLVEFCLVQEPLMIRTGCLRDSAGRLRGGGGVYG